MFFFVVEININNDEPAVQLGTSEKTSIINDDDEDEPSMLDTFTSEQLARRPSFKYVNYAYISGHVLMDCVKLQWTLVFFCSLFLLDPL